MKKMLIFMSLLFIIVISGCTRGPVSLEFVQSEIILKLQESSSIPLEYENISFQKLSFSFSTPSIATIEDDAIKAQKIGATILTVSDQAQTITSSIKVIVESNVVEKPKLYVPSNYLKVGMQTIIMFENAKTIGAEFDSFYWEINSEGIITLDNAIITAQKIGEATITATLKSDPTIFSSLVVQVSETTLKRDAHGEISEGRMILCSPQIDAKIRAGEVLQIDIDGASDLDYYFWKSYGNQIAMAASGGKIIGVSEGIAEIAAFSPLSNKIYGTIKITVYGTPNVDFASRLVETALDEEGYVEGYNNDSKFGDWFGIPNGEWCAMFVSWCANESGITTSIIPKYASCALGREWFEEKGLFKYKESYQPKKGDIIFFLSNGASHTGIVTRSDDSNVYTIEGNTADRVAQRSYPLQYRTITGYGTPRYPEFSK
ncbi:MAG: CHAP domain-containing protein [Bacilli bacterium]